MTRNLRDGVTLIAMIMLSMAAIGVTHSEALLIAAPFVWVIASYILGRFSPAD